MSKIPEKPKQSNNKTESFLQIPTSFLDDSDITLSAFKVYATLIAFKNFKTGLCFPSISKIMKRASLSKDAVRRSLNQLEDFGWIKRQKEKGKSNNYLFPSPSERVTKNRLPVPSAASVKKSVVPAKSVPTVSAAQKTKESQSDYLERKQMEFPRLNVKSVFRKCSDYCKKNNLPLTRPYFDKWLSNEYEPMIDELEENLTGGYINPMTGKGLK